MFTNVRYPPGANPRASELCKEWGMMTNIRGTRLATRKIAITCLITKVCVRIFSRSNVSHTQYSDMLDTSLFVRHLKSFHGNQDKKKSTSVSM